MNKLNLTSKMLLWALLPIVCFAIAIAATKWYCDTVIPRELVQSNTPLNWYNTSFEKLPAELKTQINPNRELRYRVADASYSFPNLKKKIADENNSNFKAYLYNIYQQDDDSWERESQWIYYKNNRMWVLESKPLGPDFEATIINIVWFLSFGICLITAIIFLFYDQPDYMPLTVFTCFITGFPFIAWLVFDASLSTLFSYGNYPEWILVALIICEISIISLVSQIYQYQLNQSLDSSKEKDNSQTEENLGLKNSILEQKLNKFTLDTRKFIQVVENNEEKERLEIIFFDDYLPIGANNKWDKFSYNINDDDDDNYIITFIDNDNNYNIIKINDKRWSFPQLIFNGIEFTKDGKSLTELEFNEEKEYLKYNIEDELISIYTKRNFIQKTIDFITRSTAFKEKESTITHIFDNVFDETFNEILNNSNFSKYPNISDANKAELKKQVTEVIKTKIEEHGFKQ